MQLLRGQTTVLPSFLELSARTHLVSGAQVTKMFFDASQTPFGWHSKRICWSYSAAPAAYGEPPHHPTVALYSHLSLGQETGSLSMFHCLLQSVVLGSCLRSHPGTVSNSNADFPAIALAKQVFVTGRIWKYSLVQRI